MTAVECRPYSTSSDSSDSCSEFFQNIPFLGLETPPPWTLKICEIPETSKSSEETPKNLKSGKNCKARKPAKIRPQRPTICSVCERPASCCHYGVPCCNGCKTFFRRYIKEMDSLKCLYDGKCNILAFIGKHYCRACRLKRCLNVGMNPNALGKNESNSVKEEPDQEMVESDQPGPSSDIERICTKEIYRPWRQQNINPLKYAEKLMASFRALNTSDTLLAYYKSDIKTILLKKSELGRKSTQKITFRKSMTSDHPDLVENGEKVDGIEGYPFFGVLKEAIQRHWLTHDLLLTIEQAKTMPWFSDIVLEDQIKIMKNVCLVITMLTQTYYSHKANKETVTMPDGSIPLQFKPYGNNLTTLEEEVFFRVMDPLKRIHITFKEYLLLKSLIFAFYMVPDVSKETSCILRDVWGQYSSMLMRYLQRKYGISGAAERFGKIVALIEAFFGFAAKHKQLYTYGKVFGPHENQISNIMDELMA